MNGQAYVRVQASAATFGLNAAGSGGGSVSGGFRLDWTYSGGFSDIMGWTITPKLPNGTSLPPITITPDETSVENTNIAIINALKGRNALYPQEVVNWGCGTTV